MISSVEFQNNEKKYFVKSNSIVRNVPNFLFELIKIIKVLRNTFPRPKMLIFEPIKKNKEQLSRSEKDLSIQMMRINHAGEVAAQALYRGHNQ